MKFKNLLFFFLLNLFLCTYASAQFTVSGYVRTDKGLPISSATIKIYEVGTGIYTSTTTDSSGYYSTTTASGIYNISAEAPLFEIQIASYVSITSNYNQDFYLQPSLRSNGVISTGMRFFTDFEWDSPFDIDYMLDNGTTYVYLLGNTYPGYYLAKFSTATSNSLDFTNFITLDGINWPGSIEYRKVMTMGNDIYVFARKFLSDTEKAVNIYKYDKDFNLITSTSIIDNSDAQIVSASNDGTYLYTCLSDGVFGKFDSNLQPLINGSLSQECRAIFSPGDTNVYVVGYDTIAAQTNIYKYPDNNFTTPTLSTVPATDFDAYASTVNVFFAVNSYSQSGSWRIAITTFSTSDFNISGTVEFEFPGYGYINSAAVSPDATKLSVLASVDNNNGTNNNYDSVIYVFDITNIDSIKLRNIFQYPETSSWNIKASNGEVYIAGVKETDHNGAINNDIILKSFEFPSASFNNPPELLWPNEEGYYSKGVDKDYGIIGDTFTFKVLYNDIDGDSTSYIRLKLFKEGVLYSSTSLDLGGVSNVPSGMLGFSKSIIISDTGTYSYQFEAADINLSSATGAPTYINGNITVKSGFEGDLVTGLSFSNGYIIEPKFLSVTPSADGDYIYAVSDQNGKINVIRFSTDTAVPSKIVNIDIPYTTDNCVNNGYEADYCKPVSRGIVVDTNTINVYVLVDKFEYYDASNGEMWDHYVYKYDKDLNISSSVIYSNLFAITPSSYTDQSDSFYYAGGMLYSFIGRDGIMEVSPVGLNISTYPFNFSDPKTADLFNYMSSMDIDVTFSGVKYYNNNHYFVGTSTHGLVFAGVDVNNITNGVATLITSTSPAFYSFGKTTIEDAELDFGKNYIYIAMTANNTDINNYMIIKSTLVAGVDRSTFTILDTKMYYAGKYGEFSNIVVGNSDNVYLVGSKTDDFNYTENSVFVKFDQDLNFIADKNVLSGYTYGVDLKLDGSENSIYVLSNVNNYMTNDYKLVVNKESNPISASALVNVDVNVTSNSNPMNSVKVVMIPFNDRGEPDAGLAKIGYTNLSGLASFGVKPGLSYFIAISTPSYGPTLKEQMMDPYQRFIKSFSADTSISYDLFLLNNSTNTVSITVDNVYPGAILSAELTLAKTMEGIAYGISKASDTTSTVEIHNVPNLSSGDYFINVSIPNWLDISTAPAVDVNTDTNFYVDFIDATPPIKNFEQVTYTDFSKQPIISGVVVATKTYSPVPNAKIELYGDDGSCSLNNSCPRYIFYTDDNGSFAVVDIDTVAYPNWNITILKAGYRPYWESSLPLPSLDREYILDVTTYSLTGVVTNFGNPIAYSKVSLRGARCYWNGDDSYANECSGGIDYVAYLDGSGKFNITGIKDGNYALSVEKPFWKEVTEGNNIDWNNIDEDDLRIVVSSQGATAPSNPPNNPCSPGKVWVLDSSGTCKGIMPYAFDIADESVVTDSTLSGELVFATTYTVSASQPLVISSNSPVLITLEENCYSNCDQRKIFTSAPIYGSFSSNVINYSVNALSKDNSGNTVTYWLNVVSNEWAKSSSFDDRVEFSTSTITRNIKLVNAGKLKLRVKKPDGTLYIPEYENDNWIDIELRGIDIDYGYGDSLDWETGELEIMNLPEGRYRIFGRFASTETLYAPLEKDDVLIKAGETTDITLQLEQGLFVQPQVFGLPSLPEGKNYAYSVIAVETGMKINRDNLNKLLFTEPKYSFDYDTTTLSWPAKPMEEGVYDFYLVLGTQYEPDGGGSGVANYEQFVNFIGSKKGVQIKKDENNPTQGSVTQPIPVEILGSVGSKELGGWIKGHSIFIDEDYEKLFANLNLNDLIPLIPTVMIYDSAGDIRGFAHAMPDNEVTFNNFMQYITVGSSASIINQIDQGTFTYHIWGLPPGNYTAVFANPNYPFVTKQITIPVQDDTYNFDFDQENLQTVDVYGMVRSSSTGSPLVNAKVYIKGKLSEKTVFTDENGQFDLTNIAPGVYKMEVSRKGFIKEGKKFVVKNDNVNLGTFYLIPSNTTLSGRVFLKRFPQPMTEKGIKVYAYDETLNVEKPSEYIPLIYTFTDEDGYFTLEGINSEHNYRIIVKKTGKMTYNNLITSSTIIADTDNNIGEIVLLDLPPQIKVTFRKNQDNENKVNVIIKTPKKLNSIPECSYSQGQYYDENNATTLALAPAPNESFIGEFIVSSIQRYYTVKVSVGDVIKLEKYVTYDSKSKIKSDQYAYEEGLLGGDLYVDEEKQEYSGLSFDPGALTQSTTTLSTQRIKVLATGSSSDSDLIGGFFSALPNVRTIKTPKGEMTLSDAIKSIMVSDVYDLNLENAQPNKALTLNLKYDKEKVSDPDSLKIYQYDEDTGEWKEVKGDYVIDPMLGTVSVEVNSISYAYDDTANPNTPFGRKKLGMSAISSDGYYKPQATSSSQSGKFAIFSAKPPTGTAYSGTSFEIYNMPNPFNLKDKTVTISSDGGSWTTGNYNTRGTIIKYFLPSSVSGNLKLVIYNMAGEKVRTLDEGSRTGGYIYYAEWDGRNDKNEDVASGVYLLVTFVNGKQIGKPHKMAVIK